MPCFWQILSAEVGKKGVEKRDHKVAHLKAVDPKKYPGLYFYQLQTLHKGRSDKT